MTPGPLEYNTRLAALAALCAASAAVAFPQDPDEWKNDSTEIVTSVLEHITQPKNIIPGSRLVIVDEIAGEDSTRYSGLTEADFILIAEELDVEVAAIKAVVSIEAGNQMKGFWAPGIPIANFDNTMFSRYKAKVKSPGAKGEKVPEGLHGFALREWSQLINARKTNADAANMATFWGMFQIGGFNYSRCGCRSVNEFVKLMAYSELEQLELFAAFISNAGMVDDLRKRNWAAFARKYNGASYAKRGYHTRMANAYKKFKAQEDRAAKQDQLKEPIE